MTFKHTAAIGLALLFSGAALAEGTAFERIDGNKDGKISQDEFIADRTAKAKEHFAKKDANKDGSISAEEWKGAKKAKKADTAPAPAKK
jgi:Ca2+-binding EF-hand superfamily protein